MKNVGPLLITLQCWNQSEFFSPFRIYPLFLDNPKNKLVVIYICFTNFTTSVVSACLCIYEFAFSSEHTVNFSILCINDTDYKLRFFFKLKQNMNEFYYCINKTGFVWICSFLDPKDLKD